MLYCEKIFAMLGQDPEVAEYASIYILYTLPGTYFFT